MQESAVLIVGAGPVGLTAALRLSQHRVPVRVVERSAESQRGLRASTFHPPTLEMLDELDVAAPLIDVGLRTDRWQVRLHETHERAEFDLGVIARDTRYPFRLQAEQRLLCQLAVDRCANDAAIELLFNHELLAVRLQDDRAVADLRTADGAEHAWSVPWLIAADGSGSTVRQSLQLPFDGLTYPETTLLVTTTFPFEDHLPGLSNVNYVWYRDGTFSLLRLPQTWRCSLYPDDDESVEEALEPQTIENKLQRIVARDSAYDVGEMRPYRVHQRILTDYRCGRVLFAGDAAHINSPSGGMGMNGGIHDAFCLADMLAEVWHGRAPPETMDQYSRQRRPIAEQQILRQADTNRARMQTRDPEWRSEELKRLQRIAADPVAAREHLLRTSMIDGLRQAEEWE